MSGAASFDNDKATELLQRVAAEDQAAYQAFYKMFSSRVYAFLRRMLNSPETADEVLVDTMYEVWRIAPQFRGDSQVSTWVLGIARNKALMALRRAGTVQHEDVDEFADLIDSGMPDGFDQLAEKQSSELIRRCLQRLSAKHRECMHLTYFEDYAVAEIAKMLDVPEGTVKSRLSHARSQMAACVSLQQSASCLI
ncbi:sigma-70 family RNA polymerase sigma factor [soil metagenome]